MGLLVEGKPLTPEQMREKSKRIREHGISQFLRVWKQVKDISEDELKFGDEIESGIFVVDSEYKTVRISLRSAELRKLLDEREAQAHDKTEGCSWHPEFGSWMIESTPSRPYGNYVTDLLRVERNMILRRSRLLSMLGPNEISPTVTNFPMLGVGDFIVDAKPFSAPHSLSKYMPDDAINPHPRFAALVENIRVRRGSKVDIRVPLFRDAKTPEFLIADKQQGAGADCSTPSSSSSSGVISSSSKKEGEKEEEIERLRMAAQAQLPPGYLLETGPEIEMDCMAFGMGMCCLQVTLQARDMDESRYMYDQFAVLAPILLALTAATPIFKGRLADVDARWNIIAASVDDRTPAERGAYDSPSLPEDQRAALIEAAKNPLMVGEGVQRIPKSRYDSVSTYIYHCRGETNCSRTFAIYNDIPCPIDAEVKAQLRREGVDENLAHHVAHLYSRDPLVAFDGQIDEVDDCTSTDHFESIQSTNWQTCRWKPPPTRKSADDPHIGWRTEFRSMEVQLTDFENAAFTVFIILITRVILAFDLALYIPLSKVDENMSRAQQRNAAQERKFFFRKHMAPPLTATTITTAATTTAAGAAAAAEDLAKLVDAEADTPGVCKKSALPSEDMYDEMTMDEIFNGKGCYYPGLVPLIYVYLDFIQCDPDTFKRVDRYLSFIARRASGELMTPATWMRQFVTQHVDYKQDSVVPPSIAHDLMIACSEIGDGSRPCPELYGDIKMPRVRKEDAYGHLLAGRLNSEERSQLLRTLAQRGNNHRPVHVARGVMPTTGGAPIAEMKE